MDELPYRAEYAKSGRSSCNSCKTTIGQGTLRLAVMVQSPMFDGRTPRWYHFMCFFGKQRPKSVADIAHIDALRWEDQEKIKAKIEEVVGVASKGVVAKEKGKAAKKRGVPASPAATGAVKDFFVEYAKSGRAGCRGCEEKILKEEIRISKKDYESEESKRFGGLDRWHHVDCFTKLRDELGFWAEGSTLPGFKTLTKEDQKLVKSKLPKSQPPEGMGADETDAGPSKKARIDDKQEALVKEQNQKLYKMRDQLQGKLKKKEMIELLTANDMEVPSGEDRILDRLSDAMVFGIPARCDQCKEGQLVFRSGVGYQCQGDLSEWTKCSNIIVEPKRTKFEVPEDLTTHSFLARYKSKPTKRVVIVRQPTAAANGNSVVDGSSTGPKIKRPPLALKNMHVVILGKTTKDKEELKKQIMKLGGKLVTKIQDKIAFVISTPEEVEKMGKRMEEVQDANVQVVPEDILDEVTADNVFQMISEKSICDWGSDPKKRIPTEEMSKSMVSKSKSVYTRSVPSKLKVQLKGGSYVDPDSELQDVAHVLRHKGELYNAVLGLTDIQANKNSYYKLQVLEADGGNKYWLFRAWGRIGTTVGGNKLESMSTLNEAVRSFKELYAEKSGNEWGDRENFVKVPGKMYPIDVDYGTDDSKALATLQSSALCKLDKPIQDLVTMLFDVDAMKKTMLEFELDLEKMPLGKISHKQMTQAYKLLSDVQKGIASGKTSDAKFLDISNRFYTLVPHSFGTDLPPIIKTEEQIKEKMDMVDNMMEIEIAYKMLEAPVAPEVHPIEFHYRQLKAEITCLDRTTYEFEIIQKYVRNTHAATHSQYELEIMDVFKVEREGEDVRFKGFKRLPNRKLLWHGSRATNFAGIISQGLRIAPPEAPATGYMFGKGIYFADMVSKSANYCCTSKTNPTGLLLLCDVALGAMYELTQAKSLKKAPDGFFSAKGIGRTEPEPAHTVKLDTGVEVPLGTPIEKKAVNTSLLYNEYIVYDVGQVKIQYLLKMHFKHKY